MSLDDLHGYRSGGMAEWREALRGYIVPLEIVLFVAALVALGIVTVWRRRRPGSLPSPHAWVLGTVLVLNGLIAAGSRLWISAAAMVLLMIALALAAVPPRSPHPTGE